jgi:hypothetical protein
VQHPAKAQAKVKSIMTMVAARQKRMAEAAREACRV